MEWVLPEVTDNYRAFPHPILLFGPATTKASFFFLFFLTVWDMSETREKSPAVRVCPSGQPVGPAVRVSPSGQSVGQAGQAPASACRTAHKHRVHRVNEAQSGNHVSTKHSASLTMHYARGKVKPLLLGSNDSRQSLWVTSAPVTFTVLHH